MTNETFDGAGEGAELALPGDMIRARHIATRASNRRKIIVLVEGDAEFNGYSIGLDERSLQILELPSGDVSTISLDHIVSISDGKQFSALPREEKDIVDRRTASFRKTAHTWLVTNWPNIYDRPSASDRRDDDRQVYSRHRLDYPRPPYVARYDRPVEDNLEERGVVTDGDQEVRN